MWVRSQSFNSFIFFLFHGRQTKRVNFKRGDACWNDASLCQRFAMRLFSSLFIFLPDHAYSPTRACWSNSLGRNRDIYTVDWLYGRFYYRHTNDDHSPLLCSLIKTKKKGAALSGERAATEVHQRLEKYSSFKSRL